ncbi:MAG TPA: hypothetical protein VF979_04640 [Streptosporangiaceae bacterium]
MRNFAGGSIDTDRELPKFEGFEQRLLDELKMMVAERRIDVIDPVEVVNPGGSPFRMPVWRRVGLVGAAGLAAGSMATAAVFAGGLVGGGSAASGNARVELTSFLAKAGAAARSHPVALPKPGQVFIEQVKAGDTGPNTGNKLTCYQVVYDTPATGRATFPAKSGPCGTKLTPYVKGKAVVAHRLSGGMTLKADHGTRGYPNPAKLPTDPTALLAALNHAAGLGHWGTGSIDLANAELFSSGAPHNAIVFGLIERLLQVPIRPALRAALFEVTGRLHGITLDRHATDIIGRPGVGISLPLPIKDNPDGLRLEFVLNAKTYRFLGVALTDSIGGNPAHPAKYGYAVIKSTLATPLSGRH